jgi:hypothetical protein
MKKLLCACIAAGLILSISDLYGQKVMRTRPVVNTCYAGNKVNKFYIPPPKEYIENPGKKGGTSITVRYNNCPANVVTVVDKAVSILSILLTDDIPIVMRVNWEEITTSGVLAQSSATGYYAGWSIEAFNPSAYYPVALAEKMAGKNLNRTADGDFVLTINSSVNWYYGTDGNTPLLNYDLETVVLHEMIHGLGFNSSFDVNGNLGYRGVLIYDTFVENQAGVHLNDSIAFPDGSSKLKTALTNNHVYFNAPMLMNYSSNTRANLYAPTTFSQGSSIAHLDPNSVLPENSLMSPFIDRAEAIHNPGKYTLSMISDFGWINTKILHEPPHDTESHLTQIDLTATIKSDTAYNHNSIGVVWSYDGFASSDTAYMTSPSSTSTYNVTLPVPGYNSRLEYYIFVKDCFQRIFRSPSRISNTRHSVLIGNDTVKPVITHTPEKFYFENIDSIKINVLATDNLGMDTVYIEYKINNGASHFLGLGERTGSYFSNSLLPDAVPLTGGDVLQYRIIAIDNAFVPNHKSMPLSGFFTADIEHVNPVAESYNTTFSNGSGDFFLDGFNISKPSTFSAFGLNTPHPYISPEETGDSIGYVAVLRTPVSFDGNGMIISYSEVVLVEPGEDGSQFGMSDFYDYVVVEGSKNYGRTWFKLVDGYDSRLKTIWNTGYNSSIVENNSTTVGKESMLFNHTFFPKVTSDIAAGDPLMIRFRLFSDPYANGWGWIIENLHIGALINMVEKTDMVPLNIFPNPGNGIINFRAGDGEFIKPVRFSVLNSAGATVMAGITAGGMEQQINITGFTSGLYFIVFHLDSGIRTIKYTLIR